MAGRSFQMEATMRTQPTYRRSLLAIVVPAVAFASGMNLSHAAMSQEAPPSSYTPVVEKETFKQTLDRMSAAKAGIEKKHSDLLSERYDLSDQPAANATMSKGKAVQGGVRAKLPNG